MKIIEPLAITDGMIGSGAGTVVEVEHPEWGGGTTYNALQKVIVKGTQNIFVDLAAGSKNWSSMAVAPNGDVYATVTGGSIWKQTGGVGVFADLSPGDKGWNGMAVAPNGDVYASVFGGSIWMQTAGAGAFNDLSAGTKNWVNMAAAPNGDIYAAVAGGSIWMRTGGAGAFADLATGNKTWQGMAAAPNGDVYASVYGGSIWKQTGGAGAFADLAAGSKNWCGMAAASNGDVYASVTSGSIWKQTGGTGAFVDLVTGSKGWWAMASAPVGDIQCVYASVYGGSIWLTTFEVLHKIYESIVGSNLGYYPPADVKQTTPKWLEISSTNKWKVFDGKTTDQMQVVSPAVYTITPGVAHDSIALLNLSMTSYRVQGTSGAYDSGTIASTATDIVLTSLGGLAANVLTITITNSGGRAKCGEIVIGNYYSLGTMRPEPSIGIVDYSVKTTDDFGDYTITERAYSKKLNCAVKVINTSIDAVFNKLAGYRVTPLVWIGNTTYTSLIIYGYWKDFSLVIGYKTYSFCSLEIEGLT